MLKHRIAALLTSIGLAGGLMSTASIASASASSVCTIEVTRLENVDLQDNDRKDEIKFELGDDMSDKFDFTQDQYRTNSLGHPRESTFGSSIDFTLYEMDSVVRTTIDSDPLSCTDGEDTTELQGNGGEYLLTYVTTH